MGMESFSVQCVQVLGSVNMEKKGEIVFHVVGLPHVNMPNENLIVEYVILASNVHIKKKNIYVLNVAGKVYVCTIA